MVLKDVQADGPAGIDVRVVYLCLEHDLGRLEGVVWREMNIEVEDAALKWTVGL